MLMWMWPTPYTDLGKYYVQEYHEILYLLQQFNIYFFFNIVLPYFVCFSYENMCRTCEPILKVKTKNQAKKNEERDEIVLAGDCEKKNEMFWSMQSLFKTWKMIINDRSVRGWKNRREQY